MCVDLTILFAQNKTELEIYVAHLYFRVHIYRWPVLVATFGICCLLEMKVDIILSVPRNESVSLG